MKIKHTQFALIVATVATIVNLLFSKHFLQSAHFVSEKTIQTKATAPYLESRHFFVMKIILAFIIFFLVSLLIAKSYNKISNRKKGLE